MSYSEFDEFLDTVDEANELDQSVLVIAHNGMSEDMQEIDALYIIESDLKDRAVHIRVTWETKKPKEPKDIAVEYLTDGNTFKKLRIEKVRRFRDDLLSGVYCKKDMDMGLVKHRGYGSLDGDIYQTITSTLGRHATSIISFLKGRDNYKLDDLSYSDTWGSW